MENLTHWKKNNDSRYISGEDLKNGEILGKGLKSEMVVMIDKFEDAKTFDQQSQSEATKTGFWLKDLAGNKLYKPVILNNTNAKFCIEEFKSEFMEHWIGKPFVLYALPHKRHGFVARFKKYYPPATVSDKKALELLSTSTDIDSLVKNWEAISPAEKKLPTVLAKKEELKKQFTS